MEDVINKAGRVRRALKWKAPKKDQDLQALQGAREAVSLLKQFREEMKNAGLLPGHIRAKLIFHHPKNGGDIVALETREFEQDARSKGLGEPDTSALAVLFIQHDVEGYPNSRPPRPGPLKWVWARPFVTTPKAMKIIDGFVEAEKEAAKGN